jgi:hypothetical protein
MASGVAGAVHIGFVESTPVLTDAEKEEIIDALVGRIRT